VPGDPHDDASSSCCHLLPELTVCRSQIICHETEPPLECPSKTLLDHDGTALLGVREIEVKIYISDTSYFPPKVGVSVMVKTQKHENYICTSSSLMDVENTDVVSG